MEQFPYVSFLLSISFRIVGTNYPQDEASYVNWKPLFTCLITNQQLAMDAPDDRRVQETLQLADGTIQKDLLVSDLEVTDSISDIGDTPPTSRTGNGPYAVQNSRETSCSASSTVTCHIRRLALVER